MAEQVGKKRPLDVEDDDKWQHAAGEDGYVDTGLEGTGLEDTGLEGTGFEDTGLEGTGLEDTGLEDDVPAEQGGQEEDDDLFGENAEDEERVESPAQDVQLARQDELDELHDEVNAPEAEEEAAPEKKKKGEDMQEMLNIVKSFISKLEYAADQDMQDFEAGKPATRKLAMVKQLEEMIAMKKRHETLLNGGVLGAIKSWLEPLTDPKTGKIVLPHAQVRAAVYRALGRLPLDTHHQESRDRLKASRIGPLLVFYSKCSAETPANQKSANELVRNWIMPIVEEGRHDMRNQELAAQRRAEAKRQLKQRRQQEREADAAEAERQRKTQEGMVVGMPGYRYHARVPKQARLDYVEMPQVPQSVSQRLAEKRERETGTRAMIKKQVLKIDRMNRTSGKQRSSTVKISGPAGDA